MRYSVFISYRRDGGEGFAQMFSEKLSQKKYHVFYDIEAIGVGMFDQKILREIEQANVFLLILSRGALDRCANEGDWVRREILHALELNKPIVPLFFRDFEFPETLPKGLERLPYYNGIDIRDMHFFDAKFKQLCDMINASARESAVREPTPSPVSAPKPPKLVPIKAQTREPDDIKKKKAKKYVKLAKQHNGKRFLFGITKEFQESKSLYYYLKAAELGNTEALELVYCYDYVPPLTPKLERAAKMGKANAQYGCGMNHLRNSQAGRGDRYELHLAVELLQKAAVQGYIPAQCILGNIYSHKGPAGYSFKYFDSPDYQQAAYWYGKAAEQGVAYAHGRLGEFYLLGMGGMKDEATAVLHLRFAAVQGEAEAQYLLGGCYHAGKGVNRDKQQAIQWYDMAAAQGHVRAQRALISLK